MWGRELPWVLSEQLGLGPRACDEKPGQHQSGKRAQAPRCVIWLALASVLDSRLLGAGPCQAQEGLAATVGDRACEPFRGRPGQRLTAARSRSSVAAAGVRLYNMH